VVIPSTGTLCGSYRRSGEEDEVCHQRGLPHRRVYLRWSSYPFDEMLKKKGSEVPSEVEPIGNYTVQRLKEFDGKMVESVAKEGSIQANASPLAPFLRFMETLGRRGYEGLCVVDRLDMHAVQQRR
jgi:hypothetical protein